MCEKLRWQPAVAACGGGRGAWLFAEKTVRDFSFQLFNFGGIV